MSWNHLCRFRGATGLRKIGQVAPTRSGDYTMVQLEERWLWNYHFSGVTVSTETEVSAYFEQKIT